MANSILTPDIIANEGLMWLENGLVAGQKISTDYSSEFAMVGETISIDRPVMFYGQSDNLNVSSYNEDIVEGKETITMNRTETVKFKVTAKEKTLSLDKMSERIIQPAVKVLRDRIETEIANQYWRFYNFSGTAGTTPSTYKALGLPGAIMTDAGVPDDGRIALHGTDTALELADGLKSVFVQDKVRTALERNRIGRYANFENYEWVHAPTHTVGDYGGTPLISTTGLGQTYVSVKDQKFSTIGVDGLPSSRAGVFKRGDVFTIAGVFAVNPVSKQSTGRLQHFTVVEDASSNSGGYSAIKVSPAIVPVTNSIADGKAYATVTDEPADNAAITVLTGAANSTHKQSLLMHPNAMTLVTRPLSIEGGAGVKTTTKSGNRVTISCTEWVDGNTLDHNFRFDMLFAVKALDERLGARLTA